MRRTLLAAFALSTAAAAQTPGQSWWRHVEVLAADDMNGRATGSADYDRAAAYVIGRFQALGLEPAGDQGFVQPVALEQQWVDQAASAAALVGRDGAAQPLRIGDDLLVSAGLPRPKQVDAPLVFVGYGLHLPEAGWDDFANLDLKGKILVVISGGPSTLSGALKSHARSERLREAVRRGAIGVLTVDTPKAIEIPWARRRLLASQPGMFFADPTMRDVPGPVMGGMVNTDAAERLFAGSGHSFAELAALADASAKVPAFPLGVRLKATIATRREAVRAKNILAKLPGSDPKLKAETIAVTAHLDHLGVGEPIDGDRIYNGAMDDASGIAAMLEIAAQVKAAGPAPKRTMLFAAVVAEEKGLLGSRYLARRQPRAAGRIVGDFNFDMPLPLWPLKSVIVLGQGESSLGALAQRTAAAQGLALVPDPLPDRNSFTRSDQYSFVEAGIPAVAFKFGFARGTPEEQIEKTWRATRYHAPSDDLAQPVEKEEMAKLVRYVAAFSRAAADDAAAPIWNADSFFRRFVR